jgi:hypothetical protein
LGAPIAEPEVLRRWALAARVPLDDDQRLAVLLGPPDELAQVAEVVRVRRPAVEAELQRGITGAQRRWPPHTLRGDHLLCLIHIRDRDDFDMVVFFLVGAIGRWVLRVLPRGKLLGLCALLDARWWRLRRYPGSRSRH